MSNLPNPLYSADTADPVWLNSSLRLKYKSRLGLRETLSRAQKWEDICGILNEIPNEDIRSLATVLNDCPQWARKIALAQFKHGSFNTNYSKCIDAISEFQINKAYLDPKDLFPCVATGFFVRNLKASADRCHQCKLGFEEGDDILEKHCRRHWKTNPATVALNTLVILDCVAEQLAPADITNMLVALGHVPTEAWRRRFMNLFRQLPEYSDWIAQMTAKHHTMVLVGDIKRLGLHVSNSHKYGIGRNPIVVWLAAVPVSACWRNHQDILTKPDPHPDVLWVLHPNGELYKRALLNNEENEMLLLSKFWTWNGYSIAQRNMFATPMIPDEDKAYIQYISRSDYTYRSVNSGWVTRKDSWGSPIITVFYEGMEAERGYQRTVARLYQEHIPQPWNDFVCHPPLIDITSELDREELGPKLYYYTSTDMKALFNAFVFADKEQQRTPRNDSSVPVSQEFGKGKFDTREERET
ncbi:hypothetical protein EDB80DRAFT_691329 [Ilyonectria destructans]|nr:hypothetical protein EDB80DRAFT_691329 [Ilyonectria destructans]